MTEPTLTVSRADLEALRRNHSRDCEKLDANHHFEFGRSDRCSCWADEHNALLDNILRAMELPVVHEVGAASRSASARRRRSRDDFITFIVSAVASDGVVVASDTRETIDLMSDNATQSMLTPGGCIVAFGGSAMWAEALVRALIDDRQLSTAEPEHAALTIWNALLAKERGFPDVYWFIAGLKPKPSLYYFDRRGVRRCPGGEPFELDWLEPISLTKLERWYQCTPGAGMSVMARLSHQEMPLAELAPICAAAVRESARRSFHGEEKTVLRVLRVDGDWSEEDTKRALEASNRINCRAQESC